MAAVLKDFLNLRRRGEEDESKAFEFLSLGILWKVDVDHLSKFTKVTKYRIFCGIVREASNKYFVGGCARLKGWIRVVGRSDFTLLHVC